MSVSRVLILLFLSFLSGCTLTPAQKFEQHLQLKQQAEVYYERRDFLRAGQLYQQLILANPSDEELWFKLGNCDAQSGQSEQAKLAYQEALIRNPKMSKAWYNLALLQAKSVGITAAQMAENVASDDPALKILQENMNAFLVAFNLPVVSNAALVYPVALIEENENSPEGIIGIPSAECGLRKIIPKTGYFECSCDSPENVL